MIPIGLTINDSPTIVLTMKDRVENARGKAVKVNEDGLAEICSTNDSSFFGLVLLQGRKTIHAGEEFTCQIKDIGIGIASDEIKVGDYVECTTDGKLKKSTSGFAIGQAVTGAVADEQAFYVQITKTGSI